jgi:hypothetical protein
MLPQLDPGMRPLPVFRHKAERGTVLQGWQHGTSGKVDANADHLVGVNPGLTQDGGNSPLQDFQVIGRVLKRPVEAEIRAIRQGLVHHSVPIGADGCGCLLSGGDLNQDGTA